MSDGAAGASSSFELLDTRIRKWIWDRNWKELQDIQERSIPVILEGKKDVIISAATGRGKTEAAFLPICSRLAANPTPGLGALYISPLKALINDQFERLESLCAALEIPVCRWHGDVSADKKRALLGHPDGILLITPESLEALFVIRGTQVPRLFGGLRYVVVDEVHSFMGSERGAQLRSLLQRIELAVRRRIPRIGLSATLGDLRMAAEFMRFDGAPEVTVIASRVGGQELQVQLRAYEARHPDDAGGDAVGAIEASIAAHLFKVLRGGNNLVFANSRMKVEDYADRLRRMAEQQRLPQEFWPHHGNLAKQVRADVEEMLKDPARPTTVICTSTLELGIDIGDVEAVAQVGVPPGVASIRQRVGRSGRRGQAAVLRGYVSECAIDAKTPIQDAIRSRTVSFVAMINLMIDGWCETPPLRAMHLSTLVQQVLSLIAQYGGLRAREMWVALCGSGPFRNVDQAMFASLLRAMANRDLVMQAADETLLLGGRGEQLVNHYSFFAAFESPEEYQVVSGSRKLGTLPVNSAAAVDSMIIFAGSRWRITAVDDVAKVLLVEAAPGGTPPMFDGIGPGGVQEPVRSEMRRIYESTDMPIFLDDAARSLLVAGRSTYWARNLDEYGVIAEDVGTVVFPWAGDSAHEALALLLRSHGIWASFQGLTIEAPQSSPADTLAALSRIADLGAVDPVELASEVANLQNEKYDEYIPEELLRAEFALKRLDVPGAINCARKLSCNSGPQSGGPIQVCPNRE